MAIDNAYTYQPGLPMEYSLRKLSQEVDSIRKASGGELSDVDVGIWTRIPAFSQITFSGSGTYSYDLRDASGVVTTSAGSGVSPETGPIYVGNNEIKFTVSNGVTVKVN